MSVFNVSGNELSSLYDKDGQQLSVAYDASGNEVFSLASSMVVMTYNVQWFTGLNANQDMQQTIINRYDADVIGLQELSQTNDIPQVGQDVLSGYLDVQIGNYGNRNGIASKYAMSSFTTVPHTDQTMDGQSYSTAYIEYDNKEIFLVVSHLTTTTYETEKVAQAREVYEAVQGHDYFIIMGDFNTGGGYTIEAPEYTTIMKQFIDAGYNSANFSNQHGFYKTWYNGSTSSASGAATDQIITSSNIAINSVVADQTKITVAAQTGQAIDHLPLIAYLTIN